MKIIGSTDGGYLVKMSSAEIDGLTSQQYRHGGYKHGSEIDISRISNLLRTLADNKDRLAAIGKDAGILVKLINGATTDG